MKERFEELLSGAKNSAETIRQTLSVKKEIKECEDRIAVMLYDLGSETYLSKTTGEMDEKTVDLLVSDITSARKKIKDLRAELFALTGKVECKNCRKVTSSDFDFCPFCGGKLYDVVIEDNKDYEEAGACACTECTENED